MKVKFVLLVSVCLLSSCTILKIGNYDSASEEPYSKDSYSSETSFTSESSGSSTSSTTNSNPINDYLEIIDDIITTLEDEDYVEPKIYNLNLTSSSVNESGLQQTIDIQQVNLQDLTYYRYLSSSLNMIPDKQEKEYLYAVDLNLYDVSDKQEKTYQIFTYQDEESLNQGFMNKFEEKGVSSTNPTTITLYLLKTIKGMRNLPIGDQLNIEIESANKGELKMKVDVAIENENLPIPINQSISICVEDYLIYEASTTGISLTSDQIGLGENNITYTYTKTAFIKPDLDNFEQII